MSTPVLIDPESGDVVLKVTSGPAAGVYTDKLLDGSFGALTQFQKALQTRRNNAFSTSAKTLKQSGNIIKKIQELQDKYAAAQEKQKGLRGPEYLKWKAESRRIADELTKLGAAPKFKYAIFGNAGNKQKANKNFSKTIDDAKIACGWGWKGIYPFRKLSPGKTSTGDCANEDLIRGKIVTNAWRLQGGTRRKPSVNRTRRGRK